MLRYFTFNTITELVCFIISVVCLLKVKSIAWQCQILFLFITCATEMAGIYIKGPGPVGHFHANTWVYNIFLVFQIGFIMLMLWHLLSKYSNSKIVVIFGLALLAFFYWFEFVTHGFLIYNNTTNIIMSVLIVFYSLYYYFHLFKDDAYINLKYFPDFWWIAGILFFSFGRIACIVFYDRLENLVIAPGYYLGHYIYNVLNVLLYGCWSYSFICKKWTITVPRS